MLLVLCVWNCQYGRVASVCEPRERKYRAAVTKVMGHNLDAVVCDTVQTARLAIEYLKTHKKAPLTFLPVEGLHATASVDNVNR